jgi:hypothetical protein
MTNKTMSEDISQLALALSKFQGSSEPVYKSKTANIGTYKYKYADLSDIFSTISETLMKFELAITQFFNEEGQESYVTTMLIHSSGQWIKSVLRLSNHEKIQQLGSEITYLRRYALSSILGIAADDDEDGAAANETTRKKAQEKALPPKGVLTDEQKNELIDLCVQVDDIKFMNQFIAYYGVTSVSDIDPVKFKHAVNWLTVKINAKGVPKHESKSA